MARRMSSNQTRLIIAIAVLAFGWTQTAGAQSKAKGQTTTGCYLRGQYIPSCSPAQQKQAAREQARLNAPPQQKGVSKKFAGVSPATANKSPLATGLNANATMTEGAVPDYFGVANYANSPYPVVAGSATNVQAGNSLLADRAYATDFSVAVGQLAPVFVVLPHAVLPAGNLVSFASWNQANPGGSPFPSAGNIFYAYVLRPTGVANQYLVVFQSQLLTVPPLTTAGVSEVATYTIATPPVVLNGDLIGFFGQGIPVDTGGVNADILSYPASTPPTQGSTITLGVDPGFPLFSTDRTYSFAANVSVPFGTISGGIRKFVDTLPGICGVGYAWTATGANNLGQCIPLAQKDTTVTFPNDPVGGSDFYRIGIKEYNLQMHSDLPGPFNGQGPGTRLRGYIQLDSSNTPLGSPQYLGPLILATRNRPVRVLFDNLLSTPLNVPVDTTYMGAGAVSDGLGHSVNPSTETRAVVHLHGGNTPWISDGTPHQWVTPALDTQGLANKVPGFAKGFSFQDVPSMKAALGLTPSINDGIATDYWTNQQSGRLMFYHEHAYGTTRLGVYNGLAAGYLIVDPVQEDQLSAATAPGTLGALAGGTTAADLSHVIPLVIQDKTFVPDAGTPGGQLAAQDPTWPLSRGTYGDLWFPHVYTPNQNPADLTGANGYGRWDWGPWFFPPQAPASLLAQPFQCTSSVYSAANPPAFPPLLCPGVPFLGASLDPAASAAGVPDTASGTPEAFMDTPVINGTAYPTITVDPTAYRFQVLNAANDRSLNLGLYVADPLTISVSAGGSGYAVPPALPPAVKITGCATASATATVDLTGAVISIAVAPGATGCVAPTVTIDPPPASTTSAQAYAVASVNTDVRMVPAIPASAGRTMPNCPVSQSLSLAGGGQVTTTLTTKTGLPAGCWPQYYSVQGYTAGTFGELGTLSWGNSDARIGGLPDPATAGPPIIQIGAEGGVLPQLAVIPSTPVSFDYNKRSITVLNVLNHGLWLGPAERADIIVDFSQFAGQTLIVYNDAPAPVPAGDPRLDYFTNDPDMSSSGGAPTTMAGYGPNMRTIMQVVVNNTPPSAALNLGTLTAAIPGIFAAAQASEPPIVPEKVYPAALGGALTDTYIPIQATSVNAWIGGPVGSLTLTVPGAYTSAPNVTIDAPLGCTGAGCVQATATAALAPARVGSVTLVLAGSGYITPPAVTFSGGAGTGATATGTLATAGSVRSIAVVNGGSGYTSAPTVTVALPGCVGGTCAGATATASVRPNGQRNVTSITVTFAGGGYTAVPTVTISGGGGSGATATATLGFPLAGITLTNPGANYSKPLTATVASPGCTFVGCSTATASATLADAGIVLTLVNGGSGYTSQPPVTIWGGTFTAPASAVANPPTVPLLPKTIQELFTWDYGRMNATLGVEVPFTNFQNQTTIPYGYADPPTEIFKDGETQLWKITHNGVDTHFIHFHLFTVQVINRVGWDGAIKPPDPYELGMKDTVRMNPLEDIIIALRPFKQALPFPVPSSHRPMDVTRPIGTTGAWYTNVDPTNQPATVTNANINFGWEFVWHCHILGHEENDMMRAMVLAVAPNQPTSVTAVTGPKKGQITLTMSTLANTANVADPTGFTIQRATSAAGPFATVATVPVGTIAGTTASATFTDTGLASKTTYYYQVMASNLVGYTAVYTAPAVGYPNVSADSTPTAASAVAQ